MEGPSIERALQQRHSLILNGMRQARLNTARRQMGRGAFIIRRAIANALHHCIHMLKMSRGLLTQTPLDD